VTGGRDLAAFDVLSDTRSPCSAPKKNLGEIRTAPPEPLDADDQVALGRRQQTIPEDQRLADLLIGVPGFLADESPCSCASCPHRKCG
jgi:hypothetical protein